MTPEVVVIKCISVVFQPEHVVESSTLKKNIQSHSLQDIIDMGSVEVLASGPVGQPDIGYAPDLDKYLARVQRRRDTEKLESSLPVGFPTQLESDLVWDGKTIGERYNWTYELSEPEIEEIEAALAHFKCLCCHPTA